MQILAVALWGASLANDPRAASTPTEVPWPAADEGGQAAGEQAESATHDVRTVVLANGLTVMLSEDHNRSEVFGAVVVRAGSKNDPADNTGLAHYLEHMLFKGTTRLGTTDWKAEKPLQERLEGLYEQLRDAEGAQRKQVLAQISQTVRKTYDYAVPNEIDQLLEQLGGTGVNAFTSYDETVYHNVFPSSQIGPWLEIYAERFKNPVFRLFPTELEAVYEEKNKALDTTGYELYRGFMRGAFPGHPYGQSDILGEVEHLKRPSLRAMKEQFAKYYVPENMALVLAGSFDSDDVLPKIEATFGTWPAKPVANYLDPGVQPFAVDERLAVRLTPVRVGAVAYRTVPESHPDYAALRLARQLLSNPQRSGLVDRLSDDGKVLIAFHVPADLADHNLDVIAFVPRIFTQSFRGAERLVVNEIGRIARGEFDEQLFEALRENILTEEALKLEDNRTRGVAMAHSFVAQGGWQGHLEHLERLRRLTKGDVQEVAARLFAQQRLILRSRVGFPKHDKLAKPDVPPVKSRRGAHSEFFVDLQSRPQTLPKLNLVDVSKDISSARLPSGARVSRNVNPSNDIYRLELRFGVGTDALRELDVLDDYLGRIGTEAHPGNRFREALFRLSTTLSVAAEVDRFSVTLQGPEANRVAAQALLAELLREPLAERRPLRQLRREIWGYRRLARKDPANVGEALRERVLYGDNSSYRREYGPRGARLLGRRRLMSVWRAVQGYEAEFRYTGPAKVAEVAASLDGHAGATAPAAGPAQANGVAASLEGHAGATAPAVGRAQVNGVGVAPAGEIPLVASPKPAVPHVIYPRQLPGTTTVYFVPHRGAVQTQLWFAVEGDALDPADRAAADAFSEYFGGSMAGLVFQEIREFRALAYSARATYERDQEPRQHGYLLGYVGCQADKTREALDVMVGLIAQMPDRPERLSMVRSALARSQETQSPHFRDLQAEVERWRRLGYEGDPRAEQVIAYQALEFADVRRFYDRYIAGKPLAIMVVGDPRRVDVKDLARYGKVVRMPAWWLYSP